MGLLSNALSNIGNAFPKVGKTQTQKETPSQSFWGDGNIVTTAKNGTTLQPSTPYWQKKSYEPETTPFWQKSPPTATSATTTPTSSAGSASTVTSPAITTARSLGVNEVQFPLINAVVNGAMGVAEFAQNMTNNGYEWPVVSAIIEKLEGTEKTPTVVDTSGDTLTDAIVNQQLDKVGALAKLIPQDKLYDSWFMDKDWWDVPFNEYNWTGKMLGEAPPDWMKNLSDSNHPYSKYAWADKDKGYPPPLSIKSMANEYNRKKGWPESKDVTLEGGNLVSTQTGDIMMSIADYASEFNMTEQQVYDAFGLIQPTEDIDVEGDAGGGDNITGEKTDYDWQEPTDVEPVNTDDIPNVGTWQEYYNDAFGANGYVGPEADQAFYDAQVARMDRTYDEAGKELADSINDQAEMQGVFNSLDKQALLLREQGRLNEAEAIERQAAAEKFTYTGIQREKERTEFNLQMASKWKELDEQSKKNAMDFMLGKQQNDIDLMWKNGQLDLAKFNAIVAENLGISELKLKEYGYDLQALAYAIDDKLANAKIENDAMTIIATVNSLLDQMDAQQAATLMSYMEQWANQTGSLTNG